MSRRLSAALTALAGARYVVWIVLAAPGAYLSYAYWRGDMFYGEFVHATGVLAVRLLIVTLAVTPLADALPGAGWVRWLRRRRRYLGVAVFGYSLLHAAAYLLRVDAARVVADAAMLWMWSGWAAILVMAALAATSNDWAVRTLRRGWKRLHRSVYAAAALSFAHWIVSAFDRTVGFFHLGILLALQAYRVGYAKLRLGRSAHGPARGPR